MRYGSVRIPRRTSQQSSGPGTAPPDPCISRMRPKKESFSRAITRPPPASQWPPRYLALECTIRSAPKRKGFCSAGVANVLSHTQRAPASCASAAISAMSVIFCIGLDGVSIQISRVFDWIALRTAGFEAVINPDHILVTAPASEGARITRALATKRMYVSELRPMEVSLEDVFLELTKDNPL